MIICDKNRYVYIDVPKTGSTSLDEFFLRGGGRRFLPNNGNKKHCREIPPHAADYDIIVSVRNPYKRIVSQYFFYQYINDWFKGLSFEDFMDRFLENLSTEEKYVLFPIWKYIEPIGQPDYVIRMEHMQEDLARLPYLKGMELAHRNKTKGKGSIELTPERIEKINQWAGRDFELFGYLKLNHMKGFSDWCRQGAAADAVCR